MREGRVAGKGDGIWDGRVVRTGDVVVWRCGAMAFTRVTKSLMISARRRSGMEQTNWV